MGYFTNVTDSQEYPKIGDNKYIIGQKSNEINFIDVKKTIIAPMIKKIAPIENNI
jgi:hypothetical protein